MAIEFVVLRASPVVDRMQIVAFEPFNIYSHRIDPRGVIEAVRQAAGEVKVDGPSDDWRKLVALGPKKFLGRRLQLTIKHDSDFYDGDAWARHVCGLANYFAAFPEVPRTQELQRLIHSFRFVLAFPDANLDIDGNHERVGWLYAICRHLDGVVFTPSSLRDSSVRRLIEAGGGFDAAAVLPNLPPTADHPEAISDTPIDEDIPERHPRTAARVARRALVLAAVANRGMLDHERHALDEPDEDRKYMLNWIEDLGLAEEVEPDEWELLQSPVGTLRQQKTIDAIWRFEGFVVLLWAIGMCELPPYDETVDTQEAFKAMGQFDPDTARRLIKNATLRPAEELERYRVRAVMTNWRLRNFRIHPGRMDFVEFSKDCLIGSFDLEGFRIIDHDLAIGDADASAVGCAESIACERHRAINWVLGEGRIYSETDIST
jgi:hypothetical protein